MKENREVKLALMRVAYKMRKLNMGSLLDDVLQSEYFTLETIHHFQEANSHMKGIYVSDLARRMNMASSATSRTLHTLEDKSLICREVDPDDRRNTYVCLTEKGQEIRGAAAENLNLFFDRVIVKMGPDQIYQLIELWNRMSDIMAEELNQPDITAGDGHGCCHGERMED